MNEEKEEIFFDLCNSIYKTFSFKKIHSIQELRNPKILLTLLKEM